MTRAREGTTLAAVAENFAGDLHDLIAHQVSIVAIQANAAQRLMRDDPAAARGALRSARAGAADALADLERLRRVLAAAESRSAA